jgi:hypothetical protein
MTTKSLVAKVRDLLQDKKPSQAKVFESTFVSKGNDEDDLIELNHYFRRRLADAPCATLDERECLRDDLHPTMWAKYFESHVLPTVIRFDLLKG